jgi:hypothetical protein
MLPKHNNDDMLFVVGSKKGGNAIEGTIDFQPKHPLNSGITTGRAVGIPTW